MEAREAELLREMYAYQEQAEATQAELQRIRAVLLARSQGDFSADLGELQQVGGWTTRPCHWSINARVD